MARALIRLLLRNDFIPMRLPCSLQKLQKCSLTQYSDLVNSFYVSFKVTTMVFYFESLTLQLKLTLPHSTREEEGLSLVCAHFYSIL